MRLQPMTKIISRKPKVAKWRLPLALQLTHSIKMTPIEHHRSKGMATWEGVSLLYD